MTMVMTNLLLFGAFCVTNTHESRVTSTHEKHVPGWLEETEQVENACCGCRTLRRHSQRSSLTQIICQWFGFVFGQRDINRLGSVISHPQRSSLTQIICQRVGFAFPTTQHDRHYDQSHHNVKSKGRRGKEVIVTGGKGRENRVMKLDVKTQKWYFVAKTNYFVLINHTFLQVQPQQIDNWKEEARVCQGYKLIDDDR